MRRLQISVLAFVFGASASARGQPPTTDVDHYDDSVAGEPVPSVEVFYDQLAPYGVWVDEPLFGRVFIPEEAGFRPYTNGHWEYTNVGSVWIADEPFGWATSHYGRWLYSQAYERWVWRPDTVWGPSWVEWRQSGDYFGWAPLVPDYAIEIGYTPPFTEWHYCPAARIYDPHVYRYYEAGSRVSEIHRAARPLDRYATIGGARVAVGPSAAMLHERHVNVRPTTFAMHAVGRWTPTETRAAVQRAQQRRPVVEETNRKRIEKNAPVHQVQTRVQQSKQLPQAQPPQRPQVQPPRQPQVQKQAPTPHVQKQPQPPQVEKPQPPQVHQQPQQPQVQKPPQRPQVQKQPQPPQVQKQPQQPQRPQVQKPPQPPQAPKQPQAQKQPQPPPVQKQPQQPQQPPQQQAPRQPNGEHKRESK